MQYGCSLLIDRTHRFIGQFHFNLVSVAPKLEKIYKTTEVFCGVPSLQISLAIIQNSLESASYKPIVLLFNFTKLSCLLL